MLLGITAGLPDGVDKVLEHRVNLRIVGYLRLEGISEGHLVQM